MRPEIFPRLLPAPDTPVYVRVVDAERYGSSAKNLKRKIDKGEIQMFNGLGVNVVRHADLVKMIEGSEQ